MVQLKGLWWYVTVHVRWSYSLNGWVTRKNIEMARSKHFFLSALISPYTWQFVQKGKRSGVGKEK